MRRWGIGDLENEKPMYGRPIEEIRYKGLSETDIPYFKNINFEGINCLGAKEAVVIEPLKDMPETITDIHIKASSFVTSGENRVGCDCLTSEQTTYEIL